MMFSRQPIHSHKTEARKRPDGREEIEYKLKTRAPQYQHILKQVLL